LLPTYYLTHRRVEPAVNGAPGSGHSPFSPSADGPRRLPAPRGRRWAADLPDLDGKQNNSGACVPVNRPGSLRAIPVTRPDFNDSSGSVA